MPTDNKRIVGPEDSVSYRLFKETNNESVISKINNLKNNIRSDGRKTNQQRKIFLKCGVVSQAKGSAYFEVDNTKLIVSVYDPREIPKKTDYSLKGELFCIFKYAPFSCPNRRGHQQDAEEKQHSAIMKRALESAVCRHEFPNFQVDVYVLVLENDGSALSGAITAAGIALVQAGIPMYDTITSATLAIQGRTKLLDPTLEEETLCTIATQKTDTEIDYDSHGIIVLAILSTHEQISEFYQLGNLNLDTLNESITTLMNATKEIVPLVEKCLVDYVTKTFKANGQS